MIHSLWKHRDPNIRSVFFFMSCFRWHNEDLYSEAWSVLVPAHEKIQNLAAKVYGLRFLPGTFFSFATKHYPFIADFINMLILSCVRSLINFIMNGCTDALLKGPWMADGSLKYTAQHTHTVSYVVTCRDHARCSHVSHCIFSIKLPVNVHTHALKKIIRYLPRLASTFYCVFP